MGVLYLEPLPSNNNLIPRRQMPHVRPSAVIFAVMSVPFLGIASVSAYHHAQRPAVSHATKSFLVTPRIVPTVERKITDY